MNQALKRRLVGAVFIIALAVIAIPHYLSTSQDQAQRPTLLVIPEKPALPQQDRLRTNVATLNLDELRDELHQEALDQAWVIDLGAYTDRDAAEREQAILGALAIRSFVIPSEQGQQFQLYAGPENKGEQLRDLQAKLELAGQDSSKIRPYLESEQTVR